MIKTTNYSQPNSKFPRSESLILEEQNFIIIATPWGNRDPVTSLLQNISEYFLSANSDQDATSPFAKLSSLSTAANNLNIAIQLANQKIYRENNNKEWTCGIQIFAAIKDGEEIIWAEYGSSNLILKKTNKVIPLLTNFDHSLDYSKKELLSPLPNKLIGLEPEVILNFGSFKHHTGDKLFLISHCNLQLEDFKAQNFSDIESLKKGLVQNKTANSAFLLEWDL